MNHTPAFFIYLRTVRKLLFPFSLIYWLLTSVRNYFYDKAWLRTFEFDFPIILFGNISTGGTGKTPHIEYLIRELKKDYKIATLSRGYKRKLKGYALATELSLVEDIGDEPKQFKQKFPEVEVAVSENRVNGVYYLLNDEPDVNVILMDDGFQHRRITAGLQIILTAYQHLFSDDMILPAGNLREPSSAKKRAHIVIVSKCPPGLNESEKNTIAQKLNLGRDQHLFFTTIAYGDMQPLFQDQQKTIFGKNDSYVLITGIADPKELKKYVAAKCNLIRSVSFSDHHYFTTGDISRMGRETKYILTTEKDAMRLMEQKHAILHAGLSVFTVPAEVKFLFNGDTAFSQLVREYILRYKPYNN